jgi:hypothetical protein
MVVGVIEAPKSEPKLLKTNSKKFVPARNLKKV